VIKVLSWGCGVQSTTLGEMSAQGLLEPLDVIITADTGWERQATYDARDFYAERWQEMGIHVEIVDGGDIRHHGATEHVHIPFWTSDGGPLRRQCTGEFKIMPIRRTLRTLAGYHSSRNPYPPAGTFEVWLGISLDEWHRAKPSRVQYITNRWPLLERTMDRQDCIGWLEAQHLPIPPKSACVCCPYRQASAWLEMKADAPEEFADAVLFDEENRHNPLAARGNSTADELYIWQKAEPLAEADLEFWAGRERAKYGTQLPMMLCESGHCWV
jgi:hypothetical protein